MKIQALITVREYGYTGQRDALEDYSKDRVVEVEGDTVRIVMGDTSSRAIEFSITELNCAVQALGR